MNALKDAVSQAFDNVVASGAIEAAIQKQLASTIESAIKDQFCNYSDFNKALKAKIGTLVDINLDQINLPSYRDLVSKIIQQRVGAAMTSQFTEQLDKDICELLSPAPATITLEKLLEQFVEHKLEYRDDLRGESYTLIIEHERMSISSGDYIDIYFDVNNRVGKYQCDFQIRVKGEGEVWGLKLGAADVKNQIFVGPMFGFERSLFQMYTAKTKLIIPAGATEDDFDTTFPYPGND